MKLTLGLLALVFAFSAIAATPAKKANEGKMGLDAGKVYLSSSKASAYILTKKTALDDKSNVAAVITESITALRDFAAKNNLKALPLEQSSIEPNAITVGIPLTAKPEVALGEFGVTEFPAGEAVKILHKGSSAKIKDTYAVLNKWLAKNKKTLDSGIWEIYLAKSEDPKLEKDNLTLLVAGVKKK